MASSETFVSQQLAFLPKHNSTDQTAARVPRTCNSTNSKGPPEFSINAHTHTHTLSISIMYIYPVVKSTVLNTAQPPFPFAILSSGSYNYDVISSYHMG